MYEAHPASAIFPMMSDPEIEALAADIRENGLREPLVLHPDGRLLDGRNRMKACALAGIEPHTRVWDGHGSEVAYVVSLNLRRRHLDESQRAMVAAKIANLHRGDFCGNQHKSGVSKFRDTSTTVDEAASMLNVSPASVASAKAVLKNGVPAVVEMVERGELPVSRAKAYVSERTTEEQIRDVDSDRVGLESTEIRREKRGIVINEDQRRQRLSTSGRFARYHTSLVALNDYVNHSTLTVSIAKVRTMVSALKDDFDHCMDALKKERQECSR